MRTPQERYLNDPVFNRVVNMLRGLIRDIQLTPSEIREAAMLACIHQEMEIVRPQNPDRSQMLMGEHTAPKRQFGVQP